MVVFYFPQNFRYFLVVNLNLNLILALHFSNSNIFQFLFVNIFLFAMGIHHLGLVINPFNAVWDPTQPLPRAPSINQPP